MVNRKVTVYRSEASKRARFVRECKKRGVICLKSERMAPGFPDEMLLHDHDPSEPDAVVFVELKTEGGASRAAQVVWHRKLRAMGYFVVVVTSLEEQLDFLNRFYGEPRG